MVCDIIIVWKYLHHENGAHLESEYFMKLTKIAKTGLNVYVDTMDDFGRTMIGVFDILFFIIQCGIFAAACTLFIVCWGMPVLFYDYVIVAGGKKVFKFLFGHLL